jgi:hypothetical protein
MMAGFGANCYWVSQNQKAAQDVFGSFEGERKELAKDTERAFGQTDPVLLLMLPIMTFIGSCHGKLRSSHLDLLTSTIEWLEDSEKEADMPDNSKEIKGRGSRDMFHMQDWHKVNT